MTVPIRDAIFIGHANFADRDKIASRADNLIQAVRDGALKVTIGGGSHRKSGSPTEQG